MQNNVKKTTLQRLLYSVMLLAGSVLLLIGCYPGEINSVQETDLVVTLFDQDANFSAYRTYAMPDTIIHICDVESELQDGCPSELRRTNDNMIISQVKQNLQAMGFTETDSASADVFVLLAANATEMSGYSYYWWYWDYWWGYPPGWGWYYPPATVYYEFTTGSILINMFDPDKADQSQQRLNAVWVAAINGLIGEGGNTQVRLTTTINQAFEQSAYLGEGK